MRPLRADPVGGHLYGLLLALLLGSLPAHAGTVYVTLASSTVEDGITMSTEVLVTNTTSESVTVSMHFIPQGDNGVERPPDFAPVTEVVPAFETRIFTEVTQGSGRGLLEVSAPGGVGVSARLVSTNSSGDESSTEVPVVGSEELIAAGTFHLVNGWIRDESHRTSYGLVNLSGAANTCLVQVISAGGQALINVTSLVVPPLSLAYFSDAVLAAGSSSIRDARIQVMCDGAAYSFSVVRNIETGVLGTLRPAADGSSALNVPGQLQCTSQEFCLERRGVFLIPSPAEPLIKIDFDPPANSYGALSLQMTVTHGGWSTIDPEGLHSLFWLVPVGSDGRTQWPQTPAYVNLRGPGRNLLINNSILDDERPTADAFLSAGQTFRVDFLYDARNRTSRATLLRLDGSVIAQVTHDIDAPFLDTSSVQRLEIGLERGDVEVPSYGWTYRDLEVRLLP